MKLKNLKSIDLKGKRVLLRVAFDVPLEKRGRGWKVADDSRIKASIPTIRYLLKNKCKIIIASWLGRPGGIYVEKYKMDPVAHRLSDLLKRPVKKVDACSGPGVELIAAKMKQRDILFLENVRFSAEEEEKKADFGKKLAALADVVVFEAFAQSHRDVPSTTGLLAHLPSVAGFHMEKEVRELSLLLEKPKAPFVVVLGGAKISDKVDTLRNLLPRADAILVGGAMVHNFLKAQGIKIGNSFVEEGSESKKERTKTVKLAEEILEGAKGIFINMGADFNIPKLVLPLDLVAAQEVKSNPPTTVIDFATRGQQIQWNWVYVDIGPKTVALYAKILAKAKTIFWNGPLGLVEISPFEHGTREVARCIAKNRGKTIIGGGDTEAFVRRYRLAHRYNYVSTGGGAALAFLSGVELPVLKYLRKD